MTVSSNQTIRMDGRGNDARPLFKSPPACYRTEVIHFDDVASGTVVDTSYSNAGITLAGIASDSSERRSAYAMQFRLGALSLGTNVLTLHRGSAWGDVFFDSCHGSIEVKFWQPQQSVSVWAYPVHAADELDVADNRPFIDAFAGNGTFLGRSRTELGPSDPSFFCQWQPITFVSKKRDIAKLHLSSETGGPQRVFAVFDRLAFEKTIQVSPHSGKTSPLLSSASDWP